MMFEFFDTVRVVILFLGALMYAYFDLFNRRNIPDLFAYGSVVVGFLVTLTYPIPVIGISILILFAVVAIGYVSYRSGLLGAGDFYEFAFISLVLPVQAVPFLINTGQLGLPFVISVFIATGLATIFTTPFYYVWIAAKKHGGLSGIRIDSRNFYKAFLLVFMYGALLLATVSFAGLSLLPTLILFLIAVPSAVIILYENAIYEGMVEEVYPRELEEGDMIAVQLMSKRDLSYFSKRSIHFGRLAGVKLISETKSVRRKLPVYKNAIPLAFFTLIGLMVSLLFGNVILAVLSAL